MQTVCIHALGPQIHPLYFHSVCENYTLKSIVRISLENVSSG